MALPTDHSDIPLAVIGMGCRLPGAENLEQYWRLIVEGRSAIQEVPPDRLDQGLYFNPEKGIRGKTYAKLAALLADRQFDRQRYPISEELYRSVDRMHLLMTATAADALRHAGLDPFNLASRNTAVFIGNGGSSGRLRDSTYQTHLAEAIGFLEEVECFRELPPSEREAVRRETIARLGSKIDEETDPRYLHCNMIAGTIVKAFGLTGGWLALNSACASSLHAILLGARTLQQGKADMVIVGGASEIHAHTLVLFSQAQALSACGSRPFDTDADGLVMSEGYAALVMKRLDQALADGDPIQAVVRGLGIATDGRGKSLWAPRKEGQIKAMRRAYRSGVDLAQLQYLECHATATQLGDATELETLGEVLKPVFPAGKRIPVTSVKANIGHALEAAGIAGVIKTVLCIQHQMFPPAIGVQTLNPKIDWQSAPYYVPLAPTPWNAPAPGQPRRAAVNAFGIGGLNMHVVLDEFTESAKTLVRSPAAPFATAASVDDRSIAIIGQGCILPGAIGAAQLWETLSRGLDPKTSGHSGRWTQESLVKLGAMMANQVGGFINDFAYNWRKHKVPPKQVAEADPLQFMLLEAAEQALADAGYDSQPLDREHCGVVVGTEVGGDFCDQLEMGLRLPEMQQVVTELLRQRGFAEDKIQAVNSHFADTLLKHWPALGDETGSFTTSTLASRVTKTLDLAGGAVAVDSGTTSAISALAVACDMLLSGDNDLMICAAGQRRMSAPAYDALARFGRLASGQPRSVVDQQYDGIVPGEGVGVVVLKRLADARRDGNRIHAIIRGVAMAHHASQPEAIRLAAERAYAQSGIDPAEVELAELQTDELLTSGGQELATLAVAHAGPARKQPLAISSSTAQFGHLGGGAGITGVLKASLEVEQSQLVPQVGYQRSNQALAALSQVAQPTAGAVMLTGRRLAAVANWSKGLAGYVVLETGNAAPQNAPPAEQPSAAQVASVTAQPAVAVAPVPASAHSSWQICRFAGATQEALLAELTAFQGEELALWQRAIARPFAATDLFRLAIVADGPEPLARKLQLARPQLTNPAAKSVLEQQGIFFGELPVVRPRVVFVFPGQGSQYDGMLGSLVREVPEAAQALAEIDGALARLGCPAFAQLAWPAAPGQPTPLGSDILATQLAMFVSDAVMLVALRSRGIVADAVLGHSYGEFLALFAAGAFDIETTLRLTQARCAGVALAQPGTGLLATDATPEVVEHLAAGISRELYIANYNAPDQCVVGGRRAELEQLAEVLVTKSRQARLLAVPAAFHTPLMVGASVPLQQQLAAASIGTLRVPVLSTVTNRAVRSAEEIRQNLANQLTTPVRYAALIAELASATPTVFVEVGPQQVLTRLNRRILASIPGAASLACDNPKRSGLEPLVCVQAALECLGAFPPTAIPDTTLPQTAAAPVVSPTIAPTPPNHSSFAPSSPAKPMHDANPSSAIPHFDATERRRSKMRNKPAVGVSVNSATVDDVDAEGAVIAAPRLSTPTKPVVAVPLSVSPVTVVPGAAAPVTPAPVIPSQVMASVAVSPAPAAQNGAEAKTTRSASKALPGENLESFLVNFVVEQTGYPPEVVELDADLEADLGIDSIKKAQLFGELNEYFDIAGAATGNLALEDFSTLRHVLNFLSVHTQSEVSSPAVAPVMPTSPVSPMYPLVTPTPTSGASSPFIAVQPMANLSPSASVVTSVAITPQGAPVATVAELAPEPGQDIAELESFLVNFVVEQTGYPPEVVDLDADLEADLGIDSIKKAQLFGELQEHFDLGSLAGATAGGAGGLSLDDFPTLRHVQNFLAVSRNGSSLAGTADNAPHVNNGVRPLANGAHHAANGASHAASKADYAAPAMPASAPSIAAVHTTAAVAEAASAPTHDAAELEAFLINFVVEQTGYPPEVVDLDADLEADLGIDSIKKAQLFGELQEHFDMSSLASATAGGTGGLSLDDFPTLRHVLAFLQNAGGSATAAPVQTPSSAPANGHGHHGGPVSGNGQGKNGLVKTGNGEATHTGNGQHPAAANGNEYAPQVATVFPAAPAVVSAASTRSETPYECGWQRGLSQRDQIHHDLQSFVDAALSLPGLGNLSDAVAQLSADELDELQGLADAVEVSLSTLLAHRLAAEPGKQFSWLRSTMPVVASTATPSAGLPSLPAGHICERLALDMRELPLSVAATAQPTWAGPAIVVGTGPTASALIARLQQAGLPVYVLAADTDLDVVASQIEQICAAGPAPHLFITTARDAAPLEIGDPASWLRERHRTMALPHEVCQKWVQAAQLGGWLGQTTLVATIDEGGDFGFAQGADLSQGGAVAGLLKAIFVEYMVMQNERGMRVKVIDAPATMPTDTLVSDIFRELAARTLDCEVALADGRRLIPTTAARPLVPAADTGMRRRSTWVVTGGARGITATVALELGRRYGLKLHLVGSSPLATVDPAWRDLDEAGQQQLKTAVMIAARKEGRHAAQAWERTKKDLEIDRSLRGFVAAGVAVTYHACDVSDRAALDRVLDDVRRQDGPIAGIVHGAGIERSCRFDRKQRDVVSATIDIKVGGAANLMALTRRDPVRHFLGFGSISGRLGGFGQSDYSLANEMLAKLIGAYRKERPWIRAVTFHWHPWAEVGMAARPELKEILEGKGSLGFMPPAEGVAHVVREIEAGCPEPESLVTERQHWERFSAGLREEDPQSAAAPAHAAAAPSAQRIGKLLIANVRQEGASLVADLPLDPLVEPFLVQHRLRGKALLPVVAGLEAMAQVAAAAGQRVIGYREVDMVDGLLFHADQPVVAQVRATRRPDGSFDCELTCDFRNRAGGLIKKDRLYLRAIVDVADQLPSISAALPPLPEAASFLDIAYPDHAPVYHGAPFRGVTAASCFGKADGWARIAALPLENLTGAERVSAWTLPSVVFDSAMYACGLHLWAQGGGIIALPRGIGEVRLGRAPRDGEQCLLYFVCRNLDEVRPAYDFVLVGEDGAVIMQARDYYKVAFGRGDAL